MSDLHTKRKQRINMPLLACKEHIENWKQSGLTMTEYSKQHDLHDGCLPRWKRRLAKAGIELSGSNFSKVKLSPPISDNVQHSLQTELHLPNGIKLRITNMGGVAAANLIKELMQCN